MEIQVIKTDEEYEAALAELEGLVRQDPQQGTPEWKRLELLGLVIESYESKVFPIGLPDPIEAIQFRMEQKRLSPRDLIPYFGSRSKVSEVLSRKRPLTVSMMRALHKGLGIPAEVLLQGHEKIDLESDFDWSKFPVLQMSKRKYFEASRAEIRQNGEELVRLFVSNVGPQVLSSLLPKQTRFVRSARPSDQYSLIAWAIRVITISNQSPPVERYRSGTITLDFMRDVARLSRSDRGPIEAIELLARSGVSVVIEPHLPRTYLDGAAILVYPHRPIIGLTLRNDRIDNFWFSLQHELAHISRHMHGEATEFYDDLDVDAQGDRREQEADQMAGEALIPQQAWERSPVSRSPIPEAVRDLAVQLEIHPAIVAGRYRHQYKAFRLLKEMVGFGQVRPLFPDVNWNE